MLVNGFENCNRIQKMPSRIFLNFLSTYFNVIVENHVQN